MGALPLNKIDFLSAFEFKILLAPEKLFSIDVI
jgi:hypothetical protein